MLDHQISIGRRKTMNRLSVSAVGVISLTIVGIAVFADNAASQEQTHRTTDIGRLNAASQDFIAAIAARDIRAMDKVWAHEPYATFIGPLSTTIVVGWEGVREAWEMRFGQFDRVTISVAESHIHTYGKVAWAVGVEKVELLRKTGETLSFDAFVTNVFKNKDGRWLLVSHQATPVFREAR
jgi:ketosteroid isomerase-like protein